MYAPHISYLEQGYWKLPGGPGLGIDIDEPVLERYRITG